MSNDKINNYRTRTYHNVSIPTTQADVFTEMHESSQVVHDGDNSENTGNFSQSTSPDSSFIED